MILIINRLFFGIFSKIRFNNGIKNSTETKIIANPKKGSLPQKVFTKPIKKHKRPNVKLVTVDKMDVFKVIKIKLELLVVTYFRLLGYRKFILNLCN